jgi:hypothetical protein
MRDSKTSQPSPELAAFGVTSEIKNNVANTGAVLNWWRSTKTVYFQGGPSAAKEELRAAFFAVTSKEVRPCKI